jgi:sterol desaturase/sphingolipid hydroxylase (fatty acid hydroxylase superfamily)
MESYAVVYLGLAILAPVFALLERRSGNPAPAPEARRIDWAYWLITPLFTGTFSRLLVLGVIAVLARASGFGGDAPGFLGRIAAVTPFSRLPFVLAFPIALLVADFLGYWSHRLRHRPSLWRLHAVHHAAEELTAVTAARLHPLDEALDGLVIGVPVLLLGFPLPVFAALGPFFVLHTLLLHARLSWSFGPLGYVLSSPRFHRRHHARELLPANFGGVFAFFDLLFGTFDMPSAAPAPFGISERDVPESVVGQMLYPFRRLAALVR